MVSAQSSEPVSYTHLELFMDNRENVIKEIDWMLGFLQEYRDAITDDDEERLVRILDEGSQKKIALEG